jgi:hypothetical protein
LEGSTPENVVSIASGWARVGPADGPDLVREKPAAAVLGEGIGSATIYIAARRDSDDALLFAKRPMTSANPPWSWVSWKSLGVASSTRASLVPAFGNRLAVAWRDPSSSTIKVRLYRPVDESWSATVDTGVAAAGAPQLVWDGTALDLFFVAASTRHLQHLHALSPTALSFTDRVVVADTPVRLSRFHALAYNERLHVVFAAEVGTQSPVRYTASTTALDRRSSWAPPANVGFQAASAPRLAALNDNLFAVGVGADLRVRYSRRDPNRVGPESPGTNPASLWLTAGQLLDPGTEGVFTGTETLYFGGDVYLTVSNQQSSSPGVYAMNLSRAAMKQLVTEHWGIKTRWATLGGRALVNGNGAEVQSVKDDEIPAVGDVDGDGRDDLLRFTQKAEPGVGPAPVYVARGGNYSERWPRSSR